MADHEKPPSRRKGMRQQKDLTRVMCGWMQVMQHNVITALPADVRVRCKTSFPNAAWFPPDSPLASGPPGPPSSPELLSEIANRAYWMTMFDAFDLGQFYITGHPIDEVTLQRVTRQFNEEWKRFGLRAPFVRRMSLVTWPELIGPLLTWQAGHCTLFNVAIDRLLYNGWIRSLGMFGQMFTSRIQLNWLMPFFVIGHPADHDAVTKFIAETFAPVDYLNGFGDVMAWTPETLHSHLCDIIEQDVAMKPPHPFATARIARKLRARFDEFLDSM